jgi:hypothetical protein
VIWDPLNWVLETHIEKVFPGRPLWIDVRDLEFSPPEPGQSQRRLLYVRNNGSAPARLLASDMVGEDAAGYEILAPQAGLEIAPGFENQAVVVVEFLPLDEGNADRARVVILSDAPEGTLELIAAGAFPQSRVGHWMLFD